MTDMPQQIGPYQITRELGRGGMGVVYLARDTKLDRNVAIKVLPEPMACDAERVQRFEREAKLLASVSHTNIAQVYGFEESNDKMLLVLEYVDGETLGVRIGRSPLPVDQALDVCKQIAEALEAAHDKGVIHRDLKPGNVMVKADGTVKVLDFGLAKALRDEPSESAIAESPTITADYTRPGMVLGTAPYMSPEQARGRSVDKRSDIWSFGVVLFECLTGTMLFGGDNPTDSMGAIMHRDPDWSLLPAHTPPTVQLLLRRCLTKDRKKRLHDIADARVELEEAIADPTSSMFRLAGAAVAAADARGPGRRRLMLAVAFAIGAALAVAATFGIVRSLEPAPAIERYSVLLPQRRSEIPTFLPILAVSGDGRTLAYTARGENGEQRVLARSIDQQVPETLSTGSGIRYNPTFSPDGQWIVGYDEDALLKISVRGGPAVELCKSRWSTGVTWSSDGYIYFTRFGKSDLYRVNENGGAEQSILTVASGVPRWPHALPGDRGVLFTTMGDEMLTSGGIDVYASDTGRTRRLVENGTYPMYAESGHLLFVRDSTLMAAPFDLGELALRGEPVPLPVEIDPAGLGGASLALTRDGTLYYLAGAAIRDLNLFAFDQKGQKTLLTTWSGEFEDAIVSPSGRSIAVMIIDRVASLSSIWLLDLERDIPTLLTSEPGYQHHPRFSPDGHWVYYTEAQYMGGAFEGLFRRRADGGGDAELVYTGRRRFRVESITPDGAAILIAEFSSVEQDLDASTDLSILHLGNETTYEPWLHGPFHEIGAAVSPNGRWVAYRSDVSGTRQVYVRPIEPGGARYSVSRDGGRKPAWSPDGNVLYFLSDGGGATQLKAADVIGGSGERTPFECRAPRVLFEPPLGHGGDLAIFPDGERFLFYGVNDNEGDERVELRVTRNFFEELRRLAPTGEAD